MSIRCIQCHKTIVHGDMLWCLLEVATRHGRIIKIDHDRKPFACNNCMTHAEGIERFVRLDPTPLLQLPRLVMVSRARPQSFNEFGAAQVNGRIAIEPDGHLCEPGWVQRHFPDAWEALHTGEDPTLRRSLERQQEG